MGESTHAKNKMPLRGSIPDFQSLMRALTNQYLRVPNVNPSLPPMGPMPPMPNRQVPLPRQAPAEGHAGAVGDLSVPLNYLMNGLGVPGRPRW